MTELARWDGFYGVVGSAAGALIGLQFVVMTLLAGRTTARASEAGAAFATPTIVHFCMVLFLSALLRAPWGTIAVVRVIWGVAGCIGVGYALIVTRRILRQGSYRPEFEDWLFHVVVPMAAYVVLAVSALGANSGVRAALFSVGAAALLLLFTGIHNAWDAGAYHIFVVNARPAGQPSEASKREG